MAHTEEIRKVAMVGDYVPRKCGIATFTHNVYESLAAQYPGTECLVAAVNDVPEGYGYPKEVRFEWPEGDLPAYRRTADFLNFYRVDAVCLQHEFGIFGGPAGSHVLALVRDLRMPVVTVLHTVLCDPPADYRRVLVQLTELSARVIVMSERGKAFLQTIYRVPEQKINLVPHGIPDMPFVDPNFYKDQFGVEGKHVILTFGLLSPNKGIEYMLRALPPVLRDFPNLVYVVLGATHPNLLREQGETYRFSLEGLAADLGITKNVVFYNRFVELRELTEFLGTADIYVTPYLNPAQITSGALAYAFGCGKAVISTPYWHAEELLAEGRGVLVPFRDPDALASAVLELLRDEPRRHAMRKRAYLMGREMIWSSAAHRYMESLHRARESRTGLVPRSLAARTLDERLFHLPPLQFTHLLRMTDSTGLLQHAIYGVPNFQEGYCTDDNARAWCFALCWKNWAKTPRESKRPCSPTQPSYTLPSTGRGAGSVISSATIAAGSKGSGRRIRRGARSGRWGRASAVSNALDCGPGRQNCSNKQSSLVPRPPLHVHGRLCSWASTSTFAGSAATGWWTSSATT